MAPDDVRGGATVGAGGAAVPVEHIAAEILHKDGFLRMIEQRGLFVDDFLGFLALGDVAGDAGDAIEPSIGVIDRYGTHPNPAHGAAGAHDAKFVVERIGPLLSGLDQAFPILRMDDLHELAGIVIQNIARLTEDDLEGGIDIGHPIGGEFVDPEDILDIVRELPKALFALPQLLLLRMPFGEVDDAADHSHRARPAASRMTWLRSWT